VAAGRAPPLSGFRGSGEKKGFALFFLTSTVSYRIHLTLFATSTCGANVCKWAFCTTTSFQLHGYTGCIRHVFVLGQCSMVTIGGCGSILRALGVSQILVFVATVARAGRMPPPPSQSPPPLQDKKKWVLQWAQLYAHPLRASCRKWQALIEHPDPPMPAFPPEWTREQQQQLVAQLPRRIAMMARRGQKVVHFGSRVSQSALALGLCPASACCP
jgi:hypothetical protein